MNRIRYFIVFIFCNGFINKIFSWAPGHFSQIGTITFVAMFCAINAFCITKRCENAGIMDIKKKIIIALSLVPVIFWLPFIYTMFKPSINKEV